MTTVLRSIVSGNKARFVDEESNLDLSYISDQLIIMGFPAAGLASLYRNPRSAVLAFLEKHHGRDWHIYNFCPVSENRYPSEAFYDQVSRFPFPDHHPPPLSLIPLFVHHIGTYLASKPSRVAVIHCKAGKGRSGTMTCCYLLSLPQLPGAPKEHTPAKKSSLLGHYSLRKAALAGTSKEQRHGHQDSPPQESDSSSPHSHVDSPTEASTSSSMTSLNEEQQQEQDLPAADLETVGIAEKLRGVFDLHTRQRMKPGTGKRGVSIPSQQRFVQYWSRMIIGQDARPFKHQRTPRKARVESITVRMQNEGKVLSHRQLSARISTYQQTYLDTLRSAEVGLLEQEMGQSEKQANLSDDPDWKDVGLLITEVGGLTQEAIETEIQEDGSWRLLKGPDSIEVAEDAEVQIKVLVGKTGHKHHMLPDWASLGYVWIVPSFEAPASSRQGDKWTMDFGAHDVDFRKAGLDGITVNMVWTS